MASIVPEKFLRRYKNGLEIYDIEGKLETLPDNFFDEYADIEWLAIFRTNIVELPASFGKLIKLTSLKLYETRIKSLPESMGMFSRLENLDLRSNMLDLDVELIKLAGLSSLRQLRLHGYRGNHFPQTIALLKHLRYFHVGRSLKLKFALSEMLRVIEQLPLLEEVDLDVPIDIADLDDHFLVVDRLNKFKAWFKDVTQPEEYPLILGRTKAVTFGHSVDNVLATFRIKVLSVQLSDEQRELLFGIFIRNDKALERHFTNSLIELRSKKELRAAVTNQEMIESVFECFHGDVVMVDIQHADVLIIERTTDIDTIIPFIRSHTKIITMDYISKSLTPS